jgi:hypothetical protein
MPIDSLEDMRDLVDQHVREYHDRRRKAGLTLYAVPKTR